MTPSPDSRLLLRVDIVRRDHGLAASYLAGGLAMQNLADRWGELRPWLFWPASVVGLFCYVMMVWKFQKRLGIQELTLEPGAQTVLIGARHGFSRFETPKWKDDGEALLVYGHNVSWRLIPAPREKEALIQLLQSVIGPAVPRRFSMRARRVMVFSLVLAAAVAGSIAAARPQRLFPSVLIASVPVLFGWLLASWMDRK